MPIRGLYLSFFLYKRVPELFHGFETLNAAHFLDFTRIHLDRLPATRFTSSTYRFTSHDDDNSEGRGKSRTSHREPPFVECKDERGRSSYAAPRICHRRPTAPSGGIGAESA